MRRAPQHAAGITALTVNKPDPKVLQDFLSLRFGLSRRTAKAMIDGRSVWVNRKCVWIARFELRTGDAVEVPSQIVKAAVRQGQRSQTGGRASEGQLQNPGDAVSSPRRNGRIRPLLTRRDSASPLAGRFCNCLESEDPAVRLPASGLRLPTRHVRVLWSNENYLVCDKPAGLVSCDDPKSVETILRGQEKVPTLEAVHRLDRDTTGCLLFAKNRAALVAAIEVFKTHKVSKTYHAIAAGSFRFAHRVIETPLDNQPAVSRVTREAAGADASFLRVRIETGRTNQIRRHLSSVRHPIVGDRVFGLKSARDPRFMQVPRQMLHASTLALPDPLDPRAEINVHSPLPADFRAALKLFGMGRRTDSRSRGKRNGISRNG